MCKIENTKTITKYSKKNHGIIIEIVLNYIFINIE